LREIRKEKGISQEQLALDSGLDRTYVSLMERGVQSPTLRSIIKVAMLLKKLRPQLGKRERGDQGMR
jgi:transcriptional regulator with XRE-family HTH domain